jgi:Cu2+-exporting ATPase
MLISLITQKAAARPAARHYTVVHSLPGRVRLRLPNRDGQLGEELAERLGAHRLVSSTRWVEAARSLTVHFDVSVPFERIVNELPESPRRVLPPAEQRTPPLWRQFLTPAVALAAAFTGYGMLARAVIALAAIPIARRGIRSLLARRLTIDVLDTTAVGLLLATGDVLAGGVSVALIETGERIRKRASGRARRVLRNWMGRNPNGVRLLANSHEPRVPIESVHPGQQVVVYAGEAIPVDGIVVDGTGSVDNRTWTGEAVPIPIDRGSSILAGASLAEGRVVIEVTATGDQTRAGRLAIALEDAIAANTRVSDLARRLANAFVGPVFLLGGAVFVATRDLSRLISILIVDFGTGIRIAVPTTVLTTMISGARQGILFKRGRAVEELARVDTMVFDKTGTLTSGTPSVVGILTEEGFDPNFALGLAASAEGHLPHPIGMAIRRAAQSRGLPLKQPEWSQYRQGGLEAQIEGHHVLVGNRRMFDEHGIAAARYPAAESSHALVAIDGQFAARIRLRDTLKRTARDVVRELRQSGISRILLATGDQPRTAHRIESELGLDESFGGMTPEEKAQLVRRLRADGRVVAVVGDGINDAAAMAEAQVSIAVPRGADLARETAEVVLLDEDLRLLIRALELSRNAMGIIRQNIGLVALPNSVGLGLATVGRLSPLTATLVNNGSTLLGGANALRPLLRT